MARNRYSHAGSGKGILNGVVVIVLIVWLLQVLFPNHIMQFRAGQ